MSSNTPSKLKVVGIGASAGGLDALQKLFRAIPSDTGLAFVIIQHLSPDFKSLMSELLAKHTDMLVCTAEDGEELKPNHVYLNHPRTNLILRGNSLHFQEKSAKDRTLNLPIDIFFHSLGENRQERSIGIVLSGTGSDGSRGIKTIKEAGGVALVQEPATAQFDGMPNAVIASSAVDFVLNPAEIGKKIAYLAKKEVDLEKELIGEDDSSEVNLNKLLIEVQKVSGIDFRVYKRNTILRRIEKRMSLKHTDKLTEYLDILRADEKERALLEGELLIGVSSFFRDADSFDYLMSNGIPELVKSKAPGESLRIWIAGCSTGQEAYTMAMIIDNFITTNRLTVDYKIFATDVSQRALEFASQGRYTINSSSEIPEFYLEKYFVKSGDHIEVIKRLRERILFSRHNLLVDPPFIRLDLISCRNVLIYLSNRAQEVVLNTFQFSLNHHGLLFLGSSESVGQTTQLFKPVNLHHKLFSRGAGEVQRPISSTRYTGGHLDQLSISLPKVALNKPRTAREHPESTFHRYLNKHFGPSAVFIDAAFNVLFISGDAGRRLRHDDGLYERNLLKMVGTPVASAIRGAVESLENHEEVVKLTRLTHEVNKTTYTFDITVHKTAAGAGSAAYVLIFSEDSKVDIGIKQIEYQQLSATEQDRISRLEEELERTKAELQFAIEDLETSNEELQSSNEELMSSNEELQSTNEEVQSVNEELYNVNSELQEKNVELQELSNDINNLLESSNIGTLFLDTGLRIRKFTPALKANFNLEAADIGRTITSFTSGFEEHTRERIIEQCKNSLQTFQIFEEELEDREGRFFKTRIAPFVTDAKHVEGVLLTFVDVTELKTAEENLIKANASLELSQSISGIATWVWDVENDRIIEHNENWEKLFHFPTENFSHSWTQSMRHEEDRKIAWETIEAHFQKKTDKYENTFRVYNEEEGTEIWIRNTGKAVGYSEKGEVTLVYGASMNVTEHMVQLEKLRLQEQFLDQLARLTPIGVYIYDVEKNVNTYINPAYTEILRYDLETLSATAAQADFKGFFHPEDVENVSRHMAKLTQGKDDEITYRFLHKDGHYVWCRSMDKPFDLKPDGSVKSFIGVFTDISAELEVQKEKEAFTSKLETEVKRRTQELEKAHRRLTKSLEKEVALNELKSRFVSTASHQFRTPLAAIKTNMDVLGLLMDKQDEEAAAPVKKIARRINDEVIRMTAIMDDVLSVQRIEDSTNEALKKDVDLVELCTTNLEIANHQQSDGRVATLTVHGTPRMAHIDPHLMGQALQNILANAFKFSVGKPAPQVELLFEENKMALKVVDFGIGIPKREIADISEPFFRASNALDIPGTGLGLSIVKEFLELNGCCVEIQSKLGSGTTITIVCDKNECKD